MPVLIDIHEFESRFQEALSRVKAGDEVVVTDGKLPQARLVPLGHRVPGLHPGAFDPSPDFDVELPDAFWLGRP